MFVNSEIKNQARRCFPKIFSALCAVGGFASIDAVAAPFVCQAKNGVVYQRPLKCKKKERPVVDFADLVGQVGPRGLDGAPGATGATGPQGQIGAQGPVGPVGASGLVGPQGVQGPAGLQGPQGQIGPQGLQGPSGAQGPAGTIDPVAHCEIASSVAEEIHGSVSIQLACPSNRFLLTYGWHVEDVADLSTIQHQGSQLLKSEGVVTGVAVSLSNSALEPYQGTVEGTCCDYSP